MDLGIGRDTMCIQAVGYKASGNKRLVKEVKKVIFCIFPASDLCPSASSLPRKSESYGEVKNLRIAPSSSSGMLKRAQILN